MICSGVSFASVSSFSGSNSRSTSMYVRWHLEQRWSVPTTGGGARGGRKWGGGGITLLKVFEGLEI